MKKKILKVFLGIFGAVGAAIAGLVGYQQIVLKLAQKKKDETYPMETWETEEGEVAYRSLGTGRPLLLIHSMMLGASSREWDAVIDGLSEKYHVYAVDLPGFGNSYTPEEPWTAYQYAKFLHEFIENVVKRPVCICGANGGADFALTLSMLHPENVKRLVLVSPEGIGKGFATEEDTKPLQLLLKPVAGTQKFLLGTSKKAIKAMLEDAFFAKENISDELVQRYADASRYGSHAQAAYAGIATRFYAADTKPAFEKLSVPFLMVWGEENKGNPVAHFDTAEKMKDFGSFAVFEQTGALPHMENSKAFLENVKEFLK
ncbi:MAG: alpha/beta hydrolase [Anaerotignum sp.]|nr:alpha/beta hydrolase [Anaerotignum sp.]